MGETYFRIGLTKNADPIFQPYLSVLGPGAIAMTAFFAAGTLIMGLESLKATLLILLMLSLVVTSCIFLAIWQLNNGRLVIVRRFGR